MLRHAQLRHAVLGTAASAVVACALSAPAGAASTSARSIAARPAVTTAAMDVARDVWSRSPCGGAVRIGWAALPPQTNALSSWLSVPGEPATTFEDCSITFNSALAWDGPFFCTIMVHEVGHLLGHDHVGDPASIMSAINDAPIRACASVRIAPRKASPKRRIRKRTATRTRTSRGLPRYWVH